MKGKTIIILAVLCAVFAYLSLRDTGGTIGKAGIANPRPFEKTDFGDIARVEVGKTGDKITLGIKDGQWRAVKGELDFPVDFQKLQNFVKSLIDLKLSDKKLVSKEQYSIFGLDDASEPTVVSLANSGNRNILKLTMGKSRKGKTPQNSPYPYAPDVGHYLMIEGDPAVYQSKDRIGVDITPAFWMKGTMAKAEKNDIESVELWCPYKHLLLTKETKEIQKSTDPSAKPEKETKWTASGDLPEGRHLQYREMDSFLGRVAEITATEPVAPSVRKELPEKPAYRVLVKAAGKTAFELFADERNNEWYAFTAERPDEIYKVSSWNIEEVFAAGDKLFKLEDVRLDKNLISSLTWKHDGCPDLRLSTGKGEWELIGAAPVPKIKDAARDDVLGALDKVEFCDYHKLKDKPSPKAVLAVELTGGGRLEISDLGPFSLKEGRLIALSGNSDVYSIRKTEYEKLFPTTEKLLEFDAKPDSADALKAAHLPSFYLAKENGAWKVKEGDTVRDAEKDRIDSWVKTMQSVLASRYCPDAVKFKSVTEIRITGADDRTVTLSFSEMSLGMVDVRHSLYGGSFKVRGEICRAMLKKASDFVKDEAEKDAAKEDEAIKDKSEIQTDSVPGGKITENATEKTENRKTGNVLEIGKDRPAGIAPPREEEDGGRKQIRER